METDEYVFLSDVSHIGDKIFEWDYIELVEHDIRIYYKANDEIGLGFDFYVVENTGRVFSDEDADNEWPPGRTIVECIYFGIAFFDGVRHLYMGNDDTNNYGYIYYPDLDAHIKIIKTIRELELKYCRDCLKQEHHENKTTINHSPINGL